MVSNYRIVILKSALKDKDKIKEIPALKNNVDKLIEVLKTDPFKIHRHMKNSAVITKSFIPGG